MYFTQETDYAMRILFCLAQHERRMDAASIGAEMQVTLRFALKILGKLSAAGLVNSYKGVKGGYELAHSPDKIDLLQVVETIEGQQYTISRCLSPTGGCSRGASGHCAFQQVWQEVNERVNGILGGYTLADMLQRARTLPPPPVAAAAGGRR